MSVRFEGKDEVLSVDEVDSLLRTGEYRPLEELIPHDNPELQLKEDLKNGKYTCTGSITGSISGSDVIWYPKFSKWQCMLFGAEFGNGIMWQPLEGQEPNWFWRKMQYLCFGNKWRKIK